MLSIMGRACARAMIASNYHATITNVNLSCFRTLIKLSLHGIAMYSVEISKAKLVVLLMLGIVFLISMYKACSKRRILHVPNAFKTIDNQLKCLIIRCFECIRRM
jgi:hypothetical protein